MEKKTFTLPVRGVNFYCEMRGHGPLVVLVPDGANDCGPYDTFSRELCDEFTVVTFDMRGGTRSMDYSPSKVTPSVLGDDVAGIIEALDMGKATIYGCSSGGQAVLAAGKRHPELLRNVMVHEAALQADGPLPGTGFKFFESIATFDKYMTGGMKPGDVWSITNADAIEKLDKDMLKRIDENNVFWREWYLGTVDMDSYYEEDFAKMPPVNFSVGAWTPACVVYSNIVTAQRGNCPVKWFNCSHHPEIICPKEYTDYMRQVIRQYL